MVVVDKSAVKDDAPVRFKSAGNGIGGLDRGATIFGRPQAAFRIGFDNKTPKVRDSAVDFIGFGLPPGGYLSIERIESSQVSDYHRTRKIDRKGHFYAPWSKLIGNASELEDHVGLKCAQIGVDIVDREAIDPDGGEQTAI